MDEKVVTFQKRFAEVAASCQKFCYMDAIPIVV